MPTENYVGYWVWILLIIATLNAEFLSAGQQVNRPAKPISITVVEVLAAFWDYGTMAR